MYYKIILQKHLADFCSINCIKGCLFHQILINIKDYYEKNVLVNLIGQPSHPIQFPFLKCLLIICVSSFANKFSAYILCLKFKVLKMFCYCTL